jgi:hypothetical protein
MGGRKTRRDYERAGAIKLLQVLKTRRRLR